ncbi:hypothetical protein IWZ00DRAFT_550758 [Phyllosticta capitalensis]
MASRARPTGSGGSSSKAAAAATATATTSSSTGGMVEAGETYEERQRRYNAARVLESNEMLIWWSTVRNESLPQTRLHFENQLAGFTSDSSSDDAEWDDEAAPPAAGTPGVAVRFLFGENRRAAEGSWAEARERAYATAAATGEVPDMVALGAGAERRREGGRRSASGSGSGSGGNSPAGKSAVGKKGRRSLGGGGGGEGASA